MGMEAEGEVVEVEDVEVGGVGVGVKMGGVDIGVRGVVMGVGLEMDIDVDEDVDMDTETDVLPTNDNDDDDATAIIPEEPSKSVLPPLTKPSPSPSPQSTEIEVIHGKLRVGFTVGILSDCSNSVDIRDILIEDGMVGIVGRGSDVVADIPEL